MARESMPAEVSTTLKSCLYEGVVTHRRLTPFAHAFRYRVFYVYLDLAELDHLFAGRWLWSTARPAIARFRREDHFGDPAQPLDESVRALVEARTSVRPSGPIRLLTQLRYFGYIINPISVYYCFDVDDARVETIVAEVTNTPWGDRHCYVVPTSTVGMESAAVASGPRDGLSRWLEAPATSPDAQSLQPVRSDKALHVSPFMPMEMHYRWGLPTPNERLSLQIESHTGDGCVFDARMSLARRPITSGQLARVLLRYPCMTAQVAIGIYWQAVRLWWKGATFFPHPKRHTAEFPANPATARSN